MKIWYEFFKYLAEFSGEATWAKACAVCSGQNHQAGVTGGRGQQVRAGPLGPR